MITSGLFGLVVGLLLGLGYCYWKQLQAVYEKRDVITTGIGAVNALGAFWDSVRKV